MAEWLLTILIFVPLGGALLIALMRNEGAARTVCLMTTLVALIVAIIATAQTIGHSGAGFALEQVKPWIGGGTYFKSLSVQYHVGVDGISIWLVLLSAMLMPTVVLGSWTAIQKRQCEYYGYMLLLQTGMFGVFCALDVLLFYVFFEFTLIPLFLLIGIWGGSQRQYAAAKFFIYTVAGSVLTFAGILYTAYFGYTQTLTWSFELTHLYEVARQMPADVQCWVFLALAAGFAIKVPLFPFHTWLPLAHTEAPTAGSVLLAGVLLKLGTYGFLRLSLPMLPQASVQLAPTIAVLAIAGIIYGALVAWVQTDVKKLVAYSSVSHLGFCILGMFSLKIAGVSGSVLYMINHGLSTGALFLLVGMIYERYHTRDIHSIGGLAKNMPWLAVFLVFFTLTSIGLPGLNGFVSEFLVLLGTATSASERDGLPAGPLGYTYAVFAATGIMLGAIYMLWMVRCVLFGPLKEPKNTPDLSRGLTVDLTPREIGILVPMALACIFLGVYPKPVQDRVDDSIRSNIFAPAVVAQLEQPQPEQFADRIQSTDQEVGS